MLQRRTAIVIAHRLATVEASDRILVLKRGRLVEEGTHQELRRQGASMPTWPNFKSGTGQPLKPRVSTSAKASG